MIFSKRKLLLSLVSIVLIGALISIRYFFFDISRETNLVQLLSEKDIEKKNTIHIVELETEAIVLARKKDSLQTLVYLKEDVQGKTKYKIYSETEEKNFFSDDYAFTGIKSFEEMQNTLRLHASKSDLEKQKGVIYPTINSSEKNMKVNGQTANQIIEYKKDDKVYYFLVFENIDYSQEIHVTL